MRSKKQRSGIPPPTISYIQMQNIDPDTEMHGGPHHGHMNTNTDRPACELQRVNEEANSVMRESFGWTNMTKPHHSRTERPGLWKILFRFKTKNKCNSPD